MRSATGGRVGISIDMVEVSEVMYRRHVWTGRLIRAVHPPDLSILLVPLPAAGHGRAGG